MIVEAIANKMKFKITPSQIACFRLITAFLHSAIFEPFDTQSTISNLQWLHPVHHLENVFVLEGDVQVHLLAELAKLFVQFIHVSGGVGNITRHRHHEIFFHDPLANIHDIDIRPGHNITDAGDDADLVLARYCHNTNLPRFLLCHLFGP